MTEELTPYRIEPIALSNESTVVAEFLADRVRETAYQSEAEPEKAFIKQLQVQEKLGAFFERFFGLI